MAWVRLDDQFYDHPKFAKAGPLGLAMWATGLAWSNRNLTDGFIPTSQAKRLCDFDGIAWRCWMGETFGGGEDVSPIDVAEHLVDAGLFEKVDGGYLIHDYGDYQLTAAQQAERAQQKRDAGSRGGLAAAQARATAGATAGGQAVAQAESKPKTQSQERTTPTAAGAATSDYPALFERFWDVYPRKVEKRRALRAWKARTREGVEVDDLIRAATVYAGRCNATGTAAQFVKHPATFLGPDRLYEEWLAGPVAVNGVIYDDERTEYR